MSRPKDCRYLESHEWARRDGDLVVVGISDYAVEHLQDLVYIELPKAGTKIRKGDSFGEIESVKAVSDIYAPVSGEIAEVNEALTKDLGAVTQDPFGQGWILKVKPADAAEFDALLDLEAYEQKIAAEEGA